MKKKIEQAKDKTIDWFGSTKQIVGAAISIAIAIPLIGWISNIIAGR